MIGTMISGTSRVHAKRVPAPAGCMQSEAPRLQPWMAIPIVQSKVPRHWPRTTILNVATSFSPKMAEEPFLRTRGSCDGVGRSELHAGHGHFVCGAAFSLAFFFRCFTFGDGGVFLTQARGVPKSDTCASHSICLSSLVSCLTVSLNVASVCDVSSLCV